MKILNWPKFCTKVMNDINIVFWDFDGVIMNSNKVRDQGFRKVLKEFPQDQVDQLMDYHQENGGLSRYVKFRYFFEEIRKEEISNDDIQHLANKFSEVMLDNLMDSELLIKETMSFIKANINHYVMHIVSGSDEKELRKICSSIKIDQYFKSIHGSPTPKNRLVKILLDKHNYSPNNCILIGDSINDYDAARQNNLYFMGYNNKDLEKLSQISLF